MLKPRVLGIDYGSKRIGLAVTDPLGLMAHPLHTIPNATVGEVKKALLAVIDDRDVARIVVGIPVNMDGEPGEAAQTAFAFSEWLKTLGLPVETIDERLSTVAAEEKLAEAGHGWKKRKAKVDCAAAAVILESWLARQPQTRPIRDDDDDDDADE